MNKYVIIQRWDQSVGSTVRAVRGSVGICFHAACVWAGLLLSQDGSAFGTCRNASLHIFQMGVPMSEACLRHTPLARPAFGIPHSHTHSLAPESWLSPGATGQACLLRAGAMALNAASILAEASLLTPGILGRWVLLNGIGLPLSNAMLPPPAEALSRDGLRAAC